MKSLISAVLSLTLFFLSATAHSKTYTYTIVQWHMKSPAIYLKKISQANPTAPTYSLADGNSITETQLFVKSPYGQSWKSKENIVTNTLDGFYDFDLFLDDECKFQFSFKQLIHQNLLGKKSIATTEDRLVTGRYLSDWFGNGDGRITFTEEGRKSYLSSFETAAEKNITPLYLKLRKDLVALDAQVGDLKKNEVVFDISRAMEGNLNHVVLNDEGDRFVLKSTDIRASFSFDVTPSIDMSYDSEQKFDPNLELKHYFLVFPHSLSHYLNTDEE